MTNREYAPSGTHANEEIIMPWTDERGASNPSYRPGSVLFDNPTYEKPASIAGAEPSFC